MPPRLDPRTKPTTKPGYVHLVLVEDDSPNSSNSTFILDIPISVLETLCLVDRTIKYLKYLGWAIVRGESDLTDEYDVPYQFGRAQDQQVYFYVYHCQRAVDLNVIKTKGSSSTPTIRDPRFRTLLLQRDGKCIFTGLGATKGAHLIPFARGTKCLQLIIKSARADWRKDGAGSYNDNGGDDDDADYEDSDSNEEDSDDETQMTINDIRNGMLLSKGLHAGFDERKCAILVTPNPVLDSSDIPTAPRGLGALTDLASLPSPERYTLQWLNPPQDSNMDINNSDAKFRDLSLKLPSKTLNHYYYGCCAVKWWARDKNDSFIKNLRLPTLKVKSSGPSSHAPTGTRRDTQNMITTTGGGTVEGWMSEEEQQEWEGVGPEDIVEAFWLNTPAMQRYLVKQERKQKRVVEKWRNSLVGVV